MLKLKIYNLLAFYPVLSKLMDPGNQEQFPFEMVLKINRLYNVLKPEYQEVEKVQRLILEKYGTPQDNDQFKIIDHDKFNTAMEKLHNLEIEINIIPFTSSDFQNTKILSGADLEYMGPFIQLDFEAKTNASFDASSILMEN